MDILLNVLEDKKINQEITISGSKSESNRLLILKKLFPEISIENLSDSDDSVHMQHALSTQDELVDIGHAGTAMRFLTSYFAVQENRETVLTGSERVQNRPIEILVNALKDLGANITYEAKGGYPPIRIIGKKYYPVRGKKIDKILQSIKAKSSFKLTLGGCVIKKVNDTIIVSKET